LLIAANANVNSSKPDGSTSLFHVCQNGHLDIVKLLVLCNANINIPDTDGKTPLYIATLRAHFEVVKFLLTSHANVNASTKEGKTPLYIAANRANLELVKLLLAHNANVNAITSDGLTAIDTAAKYGYPDVIQALEGANAKVENRVIPKQVIIRRLGKTKGGEVCAANSIEELLLKGGKMLDINAKAIRNDKDAHIRDLSLMSNGQVVFLTTSEEEKEL